MALTAMGQTDIFIHLPLAPCAPRDTTLDRDGVHVWRVSLDVSEEARQCLAGCLSAEEKNRAARYRRGADRNQFIVARGSLRHILSRYLNGGPAELQFQLGRHGKPALVSDRPLHFNLSHSGDIALIAVARNRRVGVDVERVRPDFDWAPIARRFLLERDCAWLWALPTRVQVEAFFQLWTLKEALLKGHGHGLADSPDHPDDSPVSDGRQEWAGRGYDRFAIPDWEVGPLRLAPGYAAALAAEAPDHALECLEGSADP
jgi:4'-phosphopantetheinyl transferase